MTVFDALIWAGAGLTLLGLALLAWCILRVIGARRAQLSEDRMRETLQRLVPVNLGALLLSALGLIMVAVGAILG